VAVVTVVTTLTSETMCVYVAVHQLMTFYLLRSTAMLLTILLP